MATKKRIVNTANGVDLQTAFIEKTGNNVNNQNVSQTTGTAHQDGSWVCFTVICAEELVQKIRFIAREEDFSIREVIEKSFSNTIASYESKRGKKIIIKTKKKDIDSVLKKKQSIIIMLVKTIIQHVLRCII